MPPQKTNRRSRKTLSVQERLNICQLLDDGVNAEDLAVFHGIHASSIHRIKRKSKSLEDFAESGCSVALSRKRMRKPNRPDMDLKLFEWFSEKRSQGTRVTGPALCQQAVLINEEVGGPKNFKATSGWLTRFRQRHGIRHLHEDSVKDEENGHSLDGIRHLLEDSVKKEESDYSIVVDVEEDGSAPAPAVAASAEEADDECIYVESDSTVDDDSDLGRRTLCFKEENGSSDPTEKFCKDFSRRLKEEEIDPENVYHMKETALLWKWLPEKVPKLNGKRMIDFETVAKSKDRVTLGLCVNATGNHKLPLMFVHKYVDPAALRPTDIPIPVIYFAQKNACSTRKNFIDWYTDHFIPYVEQHQLKRGSTGKVLLLVDDCFAHRVPEGYHDDLFEIVFLPRRADSTTQPLEKPIQLFKKCYRERVVRSALRFSGGIEGFLANADIKICMDMVSESWNEMNSYFIRSFWDSLLENMPYQNHVDCDYKVSDIASLLSFTRKAFCDLDGRDLVRWVDRVRREEEALPVFDDDNQGTSTSEKILSRERINRMMEDLRLWRESQPGDIRAHADIILDWHYSPPNRSTVSVKGVKREL